MSKKDIPPDIDSEFDAAEVLGIVSRNSRVKKQKKTSIKFSNDVSGKTNKDLIIPSTYENVEEIANKIAAGKGLTISQRKAINLIVAFNYTPEKISEELSISIRKIQKWMRQRDFISEVLRLEKYISDKSMENRLMQNNAIIDKLYAEINWRIDNGALTNLKLNDLINFLTRLNNESRMDDKRYNKGNKNINDNNSNMTVNVNVAMGNVQERFNVRRIQRELQDSREQTRSLPAPPVTQTLTVVKENQEKTSVSK